MRLTRMAVFASLWLLCVGLVGTLAWYAIDSAGRTTQVLASENRSASPRPASSSTTSPARPTSEPAEPTQDDDPSTTSTTTSQPADDTSSSTTSTSSSSSRTTAGTPARTTTSTREARRPSSPSSSRTSPSTSTSTPSAQTLLRSTPGGSVTVTCRRDEPIDYVARPAEGWGVRTNTKGASEADIKFSDGDETWEVKARCTSGEPSASVEHKSNDD